MLEAAFGVVALAISSGIAAAVWLLVLWCGFELWRMMRAEFRREGPGR